MDFTEVHMGLVIAEGLDCLVPKCANLCGRTHLKVYSLFVSLYLPISMLCLQEKFFKL